MFTISTASFLSGHLVKISSAYLIAEDHFTADTFLPTVATTRIIGVSTTTDNKKILPIISDLNSFSNFNYLLHIHMFDHILTFMEFS